MNVQNILHTIQFFLLPDDQLHSQSLSSNRGTWRFPGAHEFCGTPRKRQNSQKSSSAQKKRKIPAPWPTLISKLSMTSMAWNISIGQFGLAAWLCSLPALVHLLIRWTWETGKSPRFLSNN